ncbi:hypothetical protein [Archangium lipolyticum]|uniref:hypothetical protein n=1 Tax=Archangium lipolyticum TaxID=2970465 RepID=UPI002149EF75|nr:hypothetical protein [Archangium lipolyticum]
MDAPPPDVLDAASPRPRARPLAALREAVRTCPWNLASGVLMGVATALALATFLDYGLTWDENMQRQYAERVLAWFRTLGRDRSAVDFADLFLYGGFFEALAQWVGERFPAGVYEGRHLVNGLFALVGLGGAWRLGSVCGGPRVGFLSALFLLLHPLYWGHAFNNPKDLPLAALSVWALAAVVRGMELLPRVPWRHALLTGGILGLVLGVRSGAIFHFGYVGLAWGGGLLVHHWRTDSRSRELLRDVGRLLLGLLLVLAVAWVVMVLFWPYGLVRPFKNPIHAISQAAAFGWDQPLRFLGRDVRGRQLPWTYLPVSIGISLPEFFYLGLLAGVGACVARWRAGGRWAGEGWMKAGLLLFAVLFPIAAAIVARSTVYDGMRHFLFVLPPLAVLAAWGVSSLWDVVGPRAVRVGVAVACAAGMAWVVGEMVSLHPYQSVYFNRLLAGGLRGAAGRFETDYWGASYREAAEWLLREYHPDTNEPIVVANRSVDFLSSYFLERASGGRFMGASDGRDPHIILTTERWDWHKRTPGRLLHVVSRQGVPLAYVFEVRPPAPRR